MYDSSSWRELMIETNGTRSERRRGLRVRGALAASCAALALVTASACSSSSTGGGSTQKDGFKQVAQDSGGALTVWVDATRLAAAKLYQKQNPSVKLNI